MRFLKDLENFGLRGEFGYDADHRAELRAAIALALAPLSKVDLAQLADLTKPPRLDGYGVSISHTHDFGGFVYARRPVKVGWDVELASRVRPELARRISTRAEFAAAPTPGLLWCAKEALFKALEDAQPKRVTDLRIDGWRKGDGGLWRFAGHGAEGIARAEGDHVFAAVRLVSK